MGQAELDQVNQVLLSGMLTTGPKVTEFEEAVKAFLGCRAAVGLVSCTGGLHTALHALGVGPGDEVIVPTMTFTATAHVVQWLGARPVLADVDRDDLCISLERIEPLVAKQTKAVIPVHFAGRAADMGPINDFCRERGIAVVEDAAHAIGARYRDGRFVGDGPNTAVFSFYATKNLSTGEGGMAVGNDPDLLETIRRRAYFGISKDSQDRYAKKGTWRYQVLEDGFKYNMDSIHAALGVAQLARLEEMNARRRRLVQLYREGLRDVPAATPLEVPLDDCTWHLFVVRIREGVGRLDRDELSIALKEWNIGSSVHYIPLHLHPHYQKAYGCRPGDFPISEEYYRQALSLPLFPDMTDEDVEYVCRVLKEIC